MRPFITFENAVIASAKHDREILRVYIPSTVLYRRQKWFGREYRIVSLPGATSFGTDLWRKRDRIFFVQGRMNQHGPKHPVLHFTRIIICSYEARVGLTCETESRSMLQGRSIELFIW